MIIMIVIIIFELISWSEWRRSHNSHRIAAERLVVKEKWQVLCYFTVLKSSIPFSVILDNRDFPFLHIRFFFFPYSFQLSVLPIVYVFFLVLHRRFFVMFSIVYFTQTTVFFFHYLHPSSLKSSFSFSCLSCPSPLPVVRFDEWTFLSLFNTHHPFRLLSISM